MAGITNVDNDFLARVAKYSGLVSVDKRANRLVARKRVSELTGIDMQTLDKVSNPHRECLGSNRPHQNPQLHALRRRRAIKHPRRLPSKAAVPKSLPPNANPKHGTSQTLRHHRHASGLLGKRLPPHQRQCKTK